MANGSNAGITLANIRSGQASFQPDNVTGSSDIKAVQKALYLYGFYPGSAPDGYYGDGTAAAVKGFQQEKGLTASGEFNMATLQALEAWSGTLYATPSATPSLETVRNGLDYYHTGDTGTVVTTIRSLLNNKGYTCATYGSYDSALVAVVKRFQGNFGLAADGLVGQSTLAVLEDATPDSNWLVSGNVQLTAGKLARAGFTNILLRRDIVASLNAALNYYGINTKMKVRQFLAQCMAETDRGRSLVEYTYRPGTTGSSGYAPYYGAGMLHLTWSANYNAYKNYKGDAKIYTPSTYATQHVAFAYAADSAGWYWDRCANINSLINWNDTAYNICNAVTIKVYGSSAQTSTRYGYYTAIANVLS